MYLEVNDFEVIHKNDTMGLINTTETDIVLDNLMSNTMYLINVAAQTSAGVSKEVRFTTIATCMYMG